jgi:hypothetical protein
MRDVLERAIDRVKEFYLQYVDAIKAHPYKVSILWPLSFLIAWSL